MTSSFTTCSVCGSPMYQDDNGNWCCPKCDACRQAPIELQIIRRAREIISDPKRWTQGESARDVSGQRIHPIHDRAVCWCAVGALDKAAHELGVLGARGWAAAYDRIYEQTPDNTIVPINDGHGGHAAVLALFDKALEGRAA